MTESTAELPKSGISVPPGQEILVQTIYGIEDQIFTPRPLIIGDKPKQTDSDLIDSDLKPTGPNINLVPWMVSRNPDYPPGLLTLIRAGVGGRHHPQQEIVYHF